jgi:hypothetical protein
LCGGVGERAARRAGERVGLVIVGDSQHVHGDPALGHRREQALRGYNSSSRWVVTAMTFSGGFILSVRMGSAGKPPWGRAPRMDHKPPYPSRTVCSTVFELAGNFIDNVEIAVVLGLAEQGAAEDQHQTP